MYILSVRIISNEALTTEKLMQGVTYDFTKDQFAMLEGGSYVTTPDKIESYSDAPKAKGKTSYYIEFSANNEYMPLHDFDGLIQKGYTLQVTVNGYKVSGSGRRMWLNMTDQSSGVDNHSGWTDWGHGDTKWTYNFSLDEKTGLAQDGISLRWYNPTSDGYLKIYISSITVKLVKNN